MVTDPLSLDQSVYMTTYTGTKFHLFEPKVEEVSVIDIAHALSMLCRFTGHCQRFYSVAQHCVLTSKLVPPAYAKEALLHDASEAYINDINRPMKHHPQMSGYRVVEAHLDRVIRLKFNLPEQESPTIKEVDNDLVCLEALQLLKPVPDWATARKLSFLQFPIPAWSPQEAKLAFLERFHNLT